MEIPRSCASSPGENRRPAMRSGTKPCPGSWTTMSVSRGSALLGRRREAHRRVPGLVRAPPNGKWKSRRSRTRLSAAPFRLGQRLRHRRVARPGPQGLRRSRRAARRGRDDGGQHGLPTRDGEGGPDVRAKVPPGMVRSHRRRGTGRSRVQANEGRLGATGSGGTWAATRLAWSRAGQRGVL